MQTKQEYYICDWTIYLFVLTLFLVFLMPSKKVLGHAELKIDKSSEVIEVYSSLDTIPPVVNEKIDRMEDRKPRFPACEEITGTEEDKNECAEKKMIDYIYDHRSFPEEAIANKIQGIVYVGFTVDVEGYLRDIYIITDPGSGTGTDAIKIVESMNDMDQRWIPAIIDGKVAEADYTISVKYNYKTTLSKDELRREEEEVFKIVEEMPRFPGCENMEGTDKEKKDCADEKMLEYIYTNLKYPEEAKEKGIEGLAVVRFKVDIDGSLYDIEIARDPGSGTGEEAKRLVESMNFMEEKWTPGKQKGRIVQVLYTLPIKFKIDDD